MSNCERNTSYGGVGCAGKLWFDIFFDTLNDQDKSLVKTANMTICFHDATNSVKFPVLLEGVKGVRG